RPDATVEAVVLGHDAIVLECGVRGFERVVELVALPQPVAAVVVADRSELRVHGPADRPQCAGASVDPDHDPLGGTGVVASFHNALCESPGRLRSLHRLEYTKSRLPPWRAFATFSGALSRFSSSDHRARSSSPNTSSASTAAAAR